MMKLAAHAPPVVAVALACFALCLPALAQSQPEHKTSLALPMPVAPVAAAPPTADTTSTIPPTEMTHARSAHHGVKLDEPLLSKTETETETGNSPLQGAGPPQGNPPPSAVMAQGAGPLLSPLQGAGPMSAREMLLGSASSLGTR